MAGISGCRIQYVEDETASEETTAGKKLHTPAEIEANDPRRKPASAAKPAAKQDKPIDLDRLRAALDKM